MKFLCPNSECRQSLAAAEELHGVEMNCPTCGVSLTVPLPALPEIELPTPPSSEEPNEIPQAQRLKGYALHFVERSSKWFKEWWARSPRQVILTLSVFGILALIMTRGSNSSPSSELESNHVPTSVKANAPSQSYTEPIQYQTCYPCGGSGIEGGKARHAPTGSFAAHINKTTGCRCGGQGVIQTPSGHVVTCPSCGGTGKRPQRRCPNCHGRGRVRIR